MSGTMPVKGVLMEPLTCGLLIGPAGNMIFFYDFLFFVSGFKDIPESIGILANSPIIHLYFIFLSILPFIDLP